MQVLPILICTFFLAVQRKKKKENQLSFFFVLFPFKADNFFKVQIGAINLNTECWSQECASLNSVLKDAGEDPSFPFTGASA